MNTLAKPKDKIRFNFRGENYEADVKSNDGSELQLTYPNEIYGPAKLIWNGENWAFGRNIIPIQILDPTSDEYTGEKFHKEPTTQFTTHQLADMNILIQADPQTFDNLCFTNKWLNAICRSKTYENQLYKARIQVHFPQYYNQIEEIGESRKMTWKQIYIALKYINPEIKDIAAHTVYNLNWVNDKSLPLLKLFDAFQLEELKTRHYVQERLPFENIQTWNYFVDNYPLQYTDVFTNIDNIDYFIRRAPWDLFKKFYDKNWEILNSNPNFTYFRVLMYRLKEYERSRVRTIQGDVSISIDENTLTQNVYSKLTELERSELITKLFKLYAYQIYRETLFLILKKFHEYGYRLAQNDLEYILRLQLPRIQKYLMQYYQIPEST